MSKFYVVGKNISYSLSKNIHEEYLKSSYDIKNIDNEDDFKSFLKEDFEYINITIPYKSVGYKECNFLDDVASKTKVTNLIIKKDNKLYGYNTDFHGFVSLLSHYHIELKDKRVLILGTGATSRTVTEVLKEMEVSSISYLSTSKKGKDIYAYDELNKVKDVDYIINTTPVGGINNDCVLIKEVNIFTYLLGYIDVNYLPLVSKQALIFKNANIPTYNGLYMLVVQALTSYQLYSGKLLKDIDIDNSFIKLFTSNFNLVLIGHPLSGKTILGTRLAESLNMKFLDIDQKIEEKEQLLISTIFQEKGESYFRKIEKEIIASYSKEKGQVISLGGGAVLDSENIAALRSSSLIINLIRKDINLKEEDINKRPLIKSEKELFALINKRKKLYDSFKDIEINNNDLEKSCQEIRRKL